MTVDIQKLKAMAEAATPGPWECREVDGLAAICHDHGWIGDNEISDSQDLADSRYMAAANPAAVLELIAEIESLQENANVRAVMSLRADVKDLIAKKNLADQAVIEIAAERDQLKAENESLRQQLAIPSDLLADAEALRKDAERYRWLRDKSESIHQFYLSTPIWFTGVKFSKENVDRTIDAMIEGSAHD